MNIHSVMYRAVVLSRNIYYKKLMKKPRIVYTQTNLNPYKNKGSLNYLNSFK